MERKGESLVEFIVRNIIGRENLIICWQMNELTHTLLAEYSHESFMADRTGLESTRLHYLAIWRDMVNLHRPVHSKIMLTDCQGGSFLSCAYCSNKLPERGPTKARLLVLLITQLRVWAHQQSACAQLSPLYIPSLYPYVTHVINYSRLSTAFLYCKSGKLGRAWERG